MRKRKKNFFEKRSLNIISFVTALIHCRKIDRLTAATLIRTREEALQTETWSDKLIFRAFTSRRGDVPLLSAGALLLWQQK